MNPPNMLYAHDVVLAVGNVWMFPIGLVIVIIIVGGFWLGFRRRDDVNHHPGPQEHPRRPEHQSHVEGTGDANETFPKDGRLLPHELGGHGEEVKPRDEHEGERKGPPPLA